MKQKTQAKKKKKVPLYSVRAEGTRKPQFEVASTHDEKSSMLRILLVECFPLSHTPLSFGEFGGKVCLSTCGFRSQLFQIPRCCENGAAALHLTVDIPP